MLATRTILSRKLFFGLSLFFFLLGTQFASAQMEDAPGFKPAVESLAKYAHPSSNKTELALKKIGFQPPAYMSSKEWTSFPAIRKIETAFFSAENKAKGNGGKFLALLAKNLSQEYESASTEPSFKSLKQYNPNSFSGFRAISKSKLAKSSLPDDMRKAISGISKYTDNGAMGGVRSILKHKLNLPEKQVYEILRTSKSNAEVLEKGLSSYSSDPVKQRNKLKGLVTDLQNSYDGAKKEPAFQKFLGKDQMALNQSNQSSRFVRSTTESNAETARTVKDANTRAAQARSAGVNRYNEFQVREYPDINSRKFRRMKINVRGFGGVIFGNEVSLDQQVGKIELIRWIPHSYVDSSKLASRFGSLEFYTTTGEEFVLNSVNLEDVYAAYHIYYDPIPGMEAAAIDQGIGLAGIYNRSFAEDGAKWDVVLHPALINLELGNAAVMADVLPLLKEKVRENLRDFASTDESVQWDLWSPPATWKVMDVPMLVYREGNSLEVRRNDSLYSPSAKDALISMFGFRQTYFGFGDDAYQSEEEDRFYDLVPALTKATYEYDRINDFAKVAALVRIGKQSKASFAFNEVPEIVPTMESIHIRSDSENFDSELSESFQEVAEAVEDSWVRDQIRTYSSRYQIDALAFQQEITQQIPPEELMELSDLRKQLMEIKLKTIALQMRAQEALK